MKNYKFQDFVLLMEEIMHHQRNIKPVANSGINYTSSGAGFFLHLQYWSQKSVCRKQLQCKLPQLWNDPQTCELWKDAGTIAEGSDQERDILAQLPLDQLLKVPIETRRVNQNVVFLSIFPEISGQNTEFQGCFVVFLGACAWEDQKVFNFLQKSLGLKISRTSKLKFPPNYDIFGLRHKAV